MDDKEDKLPQLEGVPVTLFNKSKNVTTKLVGNEDIENKVKAKRTWYNLELTKPLFVSEIEIRTEGFSSFQDLKVMVTDVSGQESMVRARRVGESFICDVDRFIKEFSFRPEERSLSRSHIASIQVQGYSRNDFRELETALSQLHFRDEKLTNREAALEQRQADFESQKAERADLSAEIGKLSSERSSIREQVSQTKDDYDGLSERYESLRASIIRSRDEEKELGQSIDDRKKEIRRVTKDLRMLPSDLAGFVEEGKRSSIVYLLMAIPFVTVVLIVTYHLFFGSIEFLEAWKEIGENSVWDIFLVRLPFVLVAIALLEICGYTVGRLMHEVIRVNRQRLGMQKISIIAKQVVETASQSVEMTDDEVFEAEVALKMQLLQVFMKEDLGEEFNYRGTGIQEFMKSIAAKLSP